MLKKITDFINAVASFIKAVPVGIWILLGLVSHANISGNTAREIAANQTPPSDVSLPAEARPIELKLEVPPTPKAVHKTVVVKTLPAIVVCDHFPIDPATGEGGVVCHPQAEASQ